MTKLSNDFKMIEAIMDNESLKYFTNPTCDSENSKNVSLKVNTPPTFRGKKYHFSCLLPRINTG